MEGMVEGARLRVHLSLVPEELGQEAAAVRQALHRLRLDVSPGDVRSADLFVGVYGDRYGPLDPDLGLSQLEAEYLAAGSLPRLVYVMPGSGRRDPHLTLLLSRIQADDRTSYRHVSDAAELARLVADDVAMVLTEAFTAVPSLVGTVAPARASAPATAAPGPTDTAPPSRPRPSGRSRIPAPWHRLIGRTAEADMLCHLITHDTRLLTLTGPGGIGKSRLAIEVATRCADSFRDGAWFVDVAALRDPALIAPTIAHALGIRESAGALPLESLKSYLAPMHALLLLDSFEHVTAAAPLIVDLLASAPLVSFFVTSRSVLRVRGEQEFPLPPLPVPEAGSVDAAASPALELFLERAEAANPGRALTEADRVAAAEICRRLDGVPLSLELAAARTRVLPPRTLLGRLADALDVLGNGPLDLPERQRALRTTLDWDYAILSEEERLVFRRLAVFPGHFTIDAAEGIVADPALDVVDALDGLAGKSLIRSMEPVPMTGEPTFVMLQTVREYAHEQLDAAGETDAVHRRHAELVLDLVERADEVGPAELEGWLSVLEYDHADIRVALDWADRALEVDVLVRLAAALGAFWRSHCHFSEGRRWLDRALALSAGQRTERRAELLNSAGYLSRARGDYDVADAQYREALAIREELGDRRRMASSLRFVGNVAYDRGDLDEADRWWRRSLAQLEGTGDEVRRMSVLNNLGVVAHHRGDEDEACRLYDETYALGVRTGSREHQARARMNQALALVGRGDLPAAHEAAAVAVAIYAELDDTWDLVDAVDVLAGVLGRQGEVRLAGWLYGGAHALRTALDVRRPLSETADHERAVAASRSGDPVAFDAAFEDGKNASLRDIVDRALGGAPS